MTEKPTDRYRSNDRSMDIVDVTYDDRSDRDEELAPHDGREFDPPSL